MTDRILQAIRDHIAEHGWPPSIEEIAERVDRSRAEVHRYLGQLEDQGRIERGPHPRQIRVVEAARRRGAHPYIAREPDAEIRFLGAEGDDDPWVAAVMARLAMGESLYGSEWAWRRPIELVREAREEALDIGAWAVLAWQALGTRRHLLLRRALAAARDRGRSAYFVLEDAETLLAEGLDR